MEVSGAVVLMVGGIAGLLACWNAARPVIDPTRRYSPLWLPAMVVAELAPFWLLVHASVLVIGLALGGWSTLVGRVGAVLLMAAVVLLLALIGRAWVGARRLRHRVSGSVHPGRGVGRFVGRRAPAPAGVSERPGISWRQGLTLDLFAPSARSERAPVCVYVHGGGWTGGDPQRQARDLYHALAQAGWVVLGVRYPFTPAVTVERQIGVIRDAVRWARHELPSVGFHAGEIVLAGGSAGAHLAAMAALTPRHADERVAACVGLYGVYDMANRNRRRAHWHKIRNEVMLAAVAEAPERYRAVSPIDQEVHDSPPFLLVHGTHDTLVPIGESEQFAGVLRAAGRPVELVPVYGAQHAYDALSGIASRMSAAVVRSWLAEVVDRSPDAAQA